MLLFPLPGVPNNFSKIPPRFPVQQFLSLPVACHEFGRITGTGIVFLDRKIFLRHVFHSIHDLSDGRAVLGPEVNLLTT